MLRVLDRVLGVRGLARKVRTPTTFWEFVDQVDRLEGSRV
jgi:hypothetical protein